MRRVKQEARLRRSGQQHLLQATPAIAFLPDQAVMPPNQGVCNARYSVLKYHYFAANVLHFQVFYWVYKSGHAVSNSEFWKSHMAPCSFHGKNLLRNTFFKSL